MGAVVRSIAEPLSVSGQLHDNLPFTASPQLEQNIWESILASLYKTDVKFIFIFLKPTVQIKYYLVFYSIENMKTLKRQM